MIAYRCYDCAAFHIGRAEESQVIAHESSGRVHPQPKCIRCGKIIQISRADFIDSPEGPILWNQRMQATPGRQTPGSTPT